MNENDDFEDESTNPGFDREFSVPFQNALDVEDDGSDGSEEDAEFIRMWLQRSFDKR